MNKKFKYFCYPCRVTSFTHVCELKGAFQQHFSFSEMESSLFLKTEVEGGTLP